MLLPPTPPNVAAYQPQVVNLHCQFTLSNIFKKIANFAIAPGGRRREGGARGRAPYVGVVAHLEGAEVRGRPAVPLGGGRAVPRGSKYGVWTL